LFGINDEQYRYKNLNKKELHKLKRLQRRQTLREIYADNKAAEEGYGPDLLKFLSDSSQDTQKFSSQEQDLIERYKARIENLEKRLGIEK